MRNLMDDLGMNMSMLKNSNLFTGDEERFRIRQGAQSADRDGNEGVGGERSRTGE